MENRWPLAGDFVGPGAKSGSGEFRTLIFQTTDQPDSETADSPRPSELELGTQKFELATSPTDMSECDELPCGVENDFRTTVWQDNIGRPHLFASLFEAVVQGSGQIFESVNAAIGAPGDQSHAEVGVVRFSQPSFLHCVSNFLL
jgi:hypothetical protein